MKVFFLKDRYSLDGWMVSVIVLQNVPLGDSPGGDAPVPSRSANEKCSHAGFCHSLDYTFPF